MILQLLIYTSLPFLFKCNVAIYYEDKGKEPSVQAKTEYFEDPNGGMTISWMVVSTDHLRRSKCVHDPKFLSFTIDIIEMMRKFRCVPLNSRKFNKLAAALSPAYLRVGGTPQDFLTFDFSASAEMQPKASDCTPKFQSWRDIKEFNLSIDYFDQIARFSEKNKLNLIFGINGRKRNDFARWDFENISKLVSHAKERKYSKISWQIGNEPYRYRKYGRYDAVTPQELSSHFNDLSNIVTRSKLSGPDITRVKRKSYVYFSSFLRAKPSLHAITFHHYFMHASESTREKYLDNSYLDKLDRQMHIIDNLLTESESDYDVWVGESGSSSGGGKEGLSDRFIAGFHYIGAIGLASLHCHKVFIRQSFYGGFYGMLDPISYNPLPDYWITYIFKQLVGEIYLNEFFTRHKDVRIHAYCNKKSISDVTFSYVNYRSSDVLFFLDEFQRYEIEIFSLTAPKDDLLSKSILLNGNILKLDSENNFPTIKGRMTDEPVRLQKLSYGFIVVKNIHIEACRK